MKKKLLALFFAAVLGTTLIVGCGKTTEPEKVYDVMIECTAEEVFDMIQHNLKTPEDASDIHWSLMNDSKHPDHPLAQVMFDYDGLTFTAKIQTLGDENACLSDLDYTWDYESEMTLSNWNGMKGMSYAYSGDEKIQLCTWYDPETGNNYSLSVVASDLDGFDLQGVVELMYQK